MKNILTISMLVLAYLASDCAHIKSEKTEPIAPVRYLSPTPLTDSERQEIQKKLVGYKILKWDIEPLIRDILYITGVRGEVDYSLLETEERYLGGVYKSYDCNGSIRYSKVNATRNMPPFTSVLKSFFYDVGYRSRTDSSEYEVLKMFAAYAFKGYACRMVRENYSVMNPMYLRFGAPKVKEREYFTAFMLYYEVYRRIGDDKAVWEFAQKATRQDVEALLQKSVKSGVVFPHYFRKDFGFAYYDRLPMNFDFGLVIDKAKAFELMTQYYIAWAEDLREAVRGGHEIDDEPEFRLRNARWINEEYVCFHYFKLGKKKKAFFCLDLVEWLPGGTTVESVLEGEKPLKPGEEEWKERGTLVWGLSRAYFDTGYYKEALRLLRLTPPEYKGRLCGLYDQMWAEYLQMKIAKNGEVKKPPRMQL